MIELQLQQGTDEWREARAKYFCASDAPAMMGDSQYKTRAALIAEKATGIVPEVDAAKQSLFDRGHEAEAKARPLAEEIINEELYPIVAVDGAGKLLASSDGATMLCNIGFEHKLYNEKLAASVRQGIVPDSHKWQLDHQIAVFGFEKIIFVVSDGTKDKFAYCWYETTPERIARLLAGWAQFEKDVAAYQPETVKPAIVADTIEDLPALTVQLVGQVAASNLETFEAAVKARIQAISTDLQTDADFVNADKIVKFLDDGEKKLELVKSQALAQTASIDQLFRTIDNLKAEMKTKRLALDKLVKAEKENRKAEIVMAARDALNAHIDALHQRIGILAIKIDAMPIQEAIKGLKSLDSMRDKVATALANAKVEANAIADRIDTNRKTVDDMSLFPDFAAVCTKAPEDFAALLSMRKQQRADAEEKRLAAEREKIRAEEQAKAEREAQERVAQQHAAQVIEATAQNQRPEAISTGTAVTPMSGKQEAAPQDTVRTIKLGEICARLGFTVTADFLASLDIHPARTEKQAKLYKESAFPAICAAIVRHVQAVSTMKLAA